MLVGPMKKRFFLAGIIGFLIMFLIAAIVVFFLWKQYDTVKEKLDVIENEKLSVYVVKNNINSKEKISIDDLELKKIHKDSVPENAYKDANIGNSNLKNNDVTKYAKIDIKAGTILTPEMIYEEEIISDDLRTQEFNMILLPTNLRQNSYIDIRLLLPSGNDYVVASKKRVMQSTEKTVWLNLDEKDMQYMSCAIIESYITNGSILYAIEYADPTVQTKATVTYPVLRAVATLILQNPNIVESVKQELTTRFGEGSTYDTDRSVFDSNVADYIPEDKEEKVELISEKVLQQIKLQQEERQKSLEDEAAALAAKQQAAKKAQTQKTTTNKD